MAVQQKKKPVGTKKKVAQKSLGKIQSSSKSQKSKVIEKTKAKPVAKLAKKNTVKITTKMKPAVKTSFSRPPLSRPSILGSLSSTVGISIPPRVQVMLDKADLLDLIVNFARALDRMDDTLLRSLFHPEASLDFGTGVFQGSSNEYVPWALSVIGAAKSTHHLLGQTRFQIDADSAFTETYAQIHIRSDKPTGREDLFMGVRYLDRIERRPAGSVGVWKIAHRKQVIDWVRTEAVSDIFFHQNPDALWSFRSKTDPSCQIAQFPTTQSSAGKMPSFLGKRYEAKSFKT